MLSVSSNTKEKLEESLQEETSDVEVAPRIFSTPAKLNDLKLILDKQREGDLVIASEEGRKLLLIQSNLVTKLQGMTFCHQETSHGISFVLS